MLSYNPTQKPRQFKFNFSLIGSLIGRLKNLLLAKFDKYDTLISVIFYGAT